MAAPVQAGDILAGKYKVDQVLGEGGMGVVVAATHIELHQQVALKFMLPAALQDQTGVERFMREARAAVRLRSEHVARVLDVGKLENGAPYIVMEFLSGEDLSDQLERSGPLPAAEAIVLLLQACVAMAEAHKAGIVHRDLKPDNLFVASRPDGSPLVKVLDFGISKIMQAPGQTGLSQTKTSVAMGSPAYMAPEQMRSAKHVDHRADIWSLGAILYQMLSSRLPFWGETVPEMFAAVLGGEPVRLGTVAPQLDPGLVEVVHRCLAKEPDARYADVGEFAAALAPFTNAQGRSLAASVCRLTDTDLGSKPRAGTANTMPYGQASSASNPALDATVPPPPSGVPPITTRGLATGEMIGESGESASGAAKKPGVLVAAAAAVLVLGIGGFVIAGGGGDDDATPTAAATTPAPAQAAAPPPVEPEPEPEPEPAPEDLVKVEAPAVEPEDPGKKKAVKLAEEASLLLQEGVPKAAVRKLEQALKADDDFADAHRLLGLAYENMGGRRNLRKAIESFETYLEKKPDAKDRRLVENAIKYAKRDADRAPSSRWRLKPKGKPTSSPEAKTEPKPKLKVPELKPKAKPKPKPDDDPFGTMQ